MFYLNKNIELTEDMLTKMIEKFITTVEPTLVKNKNYYDGIQAILEKKYNDSSKPCNKSVVNFVNNITNCYAGYLATPGHITYSSEQDIDIVMDILRYNDYNEQDANFLLDALIYGVAAELMYIDEMGKTRFRLINPQTCFGVFDDSLTGDLTHFVRMYKASEWDDSDLYYVDVYSDIDVKKYEMSGKGGKLSFVEVVPHYFSQCPANIFTLPDEKSIFDCVIGLQDLYNTVLNAEADDLEAFVDAYLVFSGVDADNDDLAALKENRVFILPEGATASWLTKNANDAQVENILKRIHDSIYRIAQCPDFSSESFVSGVSSGIAIQYRLTGCETRAGIIEGRMKKALQRRIEIICGIASLKLGEEVFRDITINFTRNIPVDVNNSINLVNSLKGLVSDKTLLAQLPFVNDVQAEIEAVQAQKQENMAIYGFNIPTTDESEEDVA